jgi:hypothetical protein
MKQPEIKKELPHRAKRVAGQLSDGNSRKMNLTGGKE